MRWWDVETWPSLAVVVGLPLGRALVLVGLTWLAARIARSSFTFATERTGADANVRVIVGRTVAGLIYVLGAVTILDTLGVPPTTLVTFLGVVGIGISLALQDILKSFFAGTYLLFERPFRIGDEISIKDQRGTVEHIGIRSTRLRTAANVLVTIPNAMLFAELVLNRTNERAPEPRVAADNERDVLPTTSPPVGLLGPDGRPLDAHDAATPARSAAPPAVAPTPVASAPAPPSSLVPVLGAAASATSFLRAAARRTRSAGLRFSPRRIVGWMRPPRRSEAELGPVSSPRGGEGPGEGVVSPRRAPDSPEAL